MAAPPLKIVLRNAVKGAKCTDVHPYYVPVPGESSRLRCKLCLEKWRKVETSRLLVAGEFLTAHVALLIVPKSVITFSKAATPSLRMHLIRDHEAVESNQAVPVGNQTLQQATARASTEKEKRSRQVALALAMNPTLTFNMLDDPWFRQAFGHPCSKAEVPRAMFALRNEVLANLMATVQGSSVSLALDGWTSWRHKKMMNIVLFLNSQAVFWRTLPLAFGKAAKVVYIIIKKAILEIEGAFISLFPVLFFLFCR